MRRNRRGKRGKRREQEKGRRRRRREKREKKTPLRSMTGRDLVSGELTALFMCASLSLFSDLKSRWWRHAHSRSTTTRFFWVLVSNDKTGSSKQSRASRSQPAAAFYFSIFGRLFQHAANRMHQILEFQGKMRIDPSTHQEVLSTAVCSRGEKRPLQVRQFFFPPNETVRWPQPSEYQIRREKYSRLLLLLLRLLSVSCSIPAHLLTVPTWRAIWNRLK